MRCRVEARRNSKSSKDITMAGISATLSRKDLAFMADDIGRELIAFLQPEDLVEAMDPEKRKALFELLAKMYASVPDIQESVDPINAKEGSQEIV